MSKLKISKATRPIAQECNDFLNTYLIEYKRRQPNTIKSYKDMFSVYFKFLKSERDKDIWKTTVDDFSSENIILFMKWLLFSHRTIYIWEGTKSAPAIGKNVHDAKS